MSRYFEIGPGTKSSPIKLLCRSLFVCALISKPSPLIFPNWEIDSLFLVDHNAPKLGVYEAMRLIGKQKLQRLLNDESACAWIRAWVAELTDANWKHPNDVGHQFPNARQSGTGHFVFPISNCPREIHLQIAFQQGIAVITDLR